MQAQLDEIKVLVQKLQSPPPQPPAAAGPAAPPPASAAQPHSLEVNLALIDQGLGYVRNDIKVLKDDVKALDSKINEGNKALDSKINEGYKALDSKISEGYKDLKHDIQRPETRHQGIQRRPGQKVCGAGGDRQRARRVSGHEGVPFASLLNNRP